MASSTAPVQDPIYCSLQEASAVYQLSSRTLRRRIADGSLPAYRFGPRLIRVKAADVEALVSPIPTAGGPSRRKADPQQRSGA